MHNSNNVVPIVVGATSEPNGAGCNCNTEAIEQELERLSAAVAGLEAALEGVSGDGDMPEQWSREVVLLRQQVAALQQQVDGISTTALEQQVEELARMVNAMDYNSIETLAAQINALSGMVRTNDGRLTTLEGCCATVRTAIENLQNSVAELGRRVTTLESQQAATSTTVGRNSGAIGGLTSRTNDLEEVAKRLKTEQKSTNDALTSTKRAVTGLTTAQEALNRRIGEVEDASLTDAKLEIVLNGKKATGELIGVGANGKIDKKYLPREEGSAENVVEFYGLAAVPRVMERSAYSSGDNPNYKVLYDTATEGFILAMPYRTGEFNINYCECARSWGDDAQWPLDTEHIYKATSTGKYYRYNGTTLEEYERTTEENPEMDIYQELNRSINTIKASADEAIARVGVVEGLQPRVAAVEAEIEKIPVQETAIQALEAKHDRDMEAVNADVDDVKAKLTAAETAIANAVGLTEQNGENLAALGDRTTSAIEALTERLNTLAANCAVDDVRANQTALNAKTEGLQASLAGVMATVSTVSGKVNEMSTGQTEQNVRLTKLEKADSAIKRDIENQGKRIDAALKSTGAEPGAVVTMQGALVNANEMLDKRGEAMEFGEVLELLPEDVRFPGVVVTWLGSDGWHTRQWTNATAWGVESNWSDFTISVDETTELVQKLVKERFQKILLLLGLADGNVPEDKGCDCRPVTECTKDDIDDILGNKE